MSEATPTTLETVMSAKTRADVLFAKAETAGKEVGSATRRYERLQRENAEAQKAYADLKLQFEALLAKATPAKK